MAENAHDTFVKDNFSQQDIARAFVEETFPASLLKKLRPDTFSLSNAKLPNFRSQTKTVDRP